MHRHKIAAAVGLATLLGSVGAVIAQATWSQADDPIVRTIPLGPGTRTSVNQLALDEDTHRLFVVGVDDGQPAGAGGTLDVLDTRTNAVLRSSTPYLYTTSLIVDKPGGHIVLTSSQSVEVLDAHSGTVVASNPEIDAGPGVAVDDRTARIFVANVLRGSVAMLDARTGILLHVSQVGTMPSDIRADAPTGHVFVSNLLSHSVSMLDARSGAVLRTIPVGARPSLVDLQGERLLVLNYDDQTLSVLDTRRGRVLHTLALAEPPLLWTSDGPSGHTFFGARNDVVVRDARTGQVLRVLPLPMAPDDLAFDHKTDRLFVVNATLDRVDVLNAANGDVERTIHVESHPSSLAIDSTMGHVFVATQGGRVGIPDPWRWVPPWLRSRIPFLPRPQTGARTVPASVIIVDESRL